VVSLNPNQFKDIYERTKEPDSGATVNVHTGAQPTSGWAVARPPHGRIVPTAEYSQKALEDYARDKAPALNEAGHLGLWHQPDEGVYEDVTDVHPPTYAGGIKAIAQAQPIMGKRGVKQRGEKAIWNIGEKEEMFMKPEEPGQHQATELSMAKLRKQAPQGKISDVSTKQLKEAYLKRKPV